MEGVADFWQRLSRARRRLLVLDYDGTLAPFRVERDEAVPLPGVREVLARLRDGGVTTVAVSSGREAGEVSGLLEVPGIPVWGSHGFEVLDGQGSLTQIPLDPRQRQGLDRAAAQLAAEVEPLRLERKHCGVALHTRGMEPEQARQLERSTARRWRVLAPGAGLECRAFNGGVELRALGQDKGTALRRVMAAHPGAELTVYVGDDDTDEDAFTALATVPGGLGVKVGPAGVSTAASGRLDDCAGVLAFLQRWADTEG